jgi:hypothetical protein
MRSVRFFVPLFVVIFLVQTVSASTDNLKIFSKQSVVLFSNFSNDIIRKIAYVTAQLHESDLKKFAQLIDLKKISKKWNSYIVINSENVFEWCLMSPMGYAFLTGRLELVAQLVNRGQSFLFENKKQKKPFEYAFNSCVFQPTMSFFLALNSQCRDYDDYPLYKKACYFKGPIDEITDRVFDLSPDPETIYKQLSFLQELSLSVLQHFFYKLAYKRQGKKINVFAGLFLKLKNNEVFKKNYVESMEFLNLFFKSYFETVLFSEIKHDVGARNIVWLNRCNRFLLKMFVDLNKIVNKKGMTPLTAAVLKDNIRMIGFLLDKHCNVSVNQIDLNGKPPLYYALKFSFEWSIKKILNHEDACVEWVNSKNGNTLFHYLAKYYCLGGPVERLLKSRLKDDQLLFKKNNDGKAYQQVERKKY